MFEAISTAAGETLSFITKMGSKLKTFGNLIKMTMKPLIALPMKGLKFLVKIKSFLGTLGKGAAKATGKSLLKKIPVIGLLVGAGMALSRASKGDYLGAAMEVASGVASIFPGIGTGISVGLDAALLGMDMGGVTGDKSTANTTVEADDFTLKTNPKDTITMAGGTKLGGNVEELLKTLIQEVKNGGRGDVNLDGFKVGEVMKLSATTT
jgi:hypothetical protein